MNIQVDTHTITITQDENINAGEYNVTTCEFEFTDEYEGLTKQAVFSTCTETYKAPIFNNQCIIPSEVLENQGSVLLGVYGYESQDEELVLRYSPKPQYFVVSNGSYREGNDPDLPEPSEWEQVLELINQAITETNNLNIAVEKEGSITTITLTKKDGTTQTVQVEDGKSLEFKWEGTSLGVRQEGQSEYQYVDLKGAKGDPGAISFEIVAELPTENIKEDTIYLVPITPDTSGNNYAEYIYVNGQWELLGKIGVQIDLTNYVQFTDYATDSKGGVFKTNGRYYATLVENGELKCLAKDYNAYNSTLNLASFISKGTLENVITGKGLVSNTYYANDSTGGVIKTSGNYGTSITSGGVLRGTTKTYAQYQSADNLTIISKITLENVLTARIGDINSVLDEINGEVI